MSAPWANPHHNVQQSFISFAEMLEIDGHPSAEQPASRLAVNRNQPAFSLGFDSQCSACRPFFSAQTTSRQLDGQQLANKTIRLPAPS